MRFLGFDEVLAIHEEILDRDGGTPGYLNLGSVDSALYRVRWGPFFGQPRLVDRAALLMRGICQDHPFVDGNKRTALACSGTFLALNDHHLAHTSNEAIQLMLDVAQDRLDLDAMAAWLALHQRINQEE